MSAIRKVYLVEAVRKSLKGLGYWFVSDHVVVSEKSNRSNSKDEKDSGDVEQQSTEKS
ncbi:hypothetical protein ACPV3P_19370 [Photobacterium damselae]|uniref:hypothetical protein n=1 Tax=Photobacterium damselae TaxID=38293 RepID=UPI004068551C